MTAFPNRFAASALTYVGFFVSWQLADGYGASCRYANHPCSLISASGGAPVADACKLQSLWGSSEGRLMVKFGGAP